ncbi:MAG: hypothetical protein V7606_323 [Burkholderiales bacterium]
MRTKKNAGQPRFSNAMTKKIPTSVAPIPLRLSFAVS